MRYQIDYPFIRAYGYFWGSRIAYVNAERKRAAADNAPQDAVYKADNGSWMLLSEIEESRQQSLLSIAFEKGWISRK